MYTQPPQSLEALGPPLACGRTAEIYAWGDGQILKLFHPQFTVNVREAELARSIHAIGIRTPAVGELMEIAGRPGILYERIDGISQLQRFQKQPWRLVGITRQLAELHADMHMRLAPGLPSQRQRILRRIEGSALPEKLRATALQVLTSLPDDDKLCHGDFHPDNILHTTQGPVIIDWMDATAGNPLADVARTYMILRFSGLPARQPARWLQQQLRSRMCAIYLQHYRHLRPFDPQQLERWLIPVITIRLEENVTGETSALLRYLEQVNVM